MSQTFSIACTECKEHIWIAQAWAHEDGSYKHGVLYTAEKYRKPILDFLMKHRGHPLIFDENCESEIAEYKEIEID